MIPSGPRALPTAIPCRAPSSLAIVIWEKLVRERGAGSGEQGFHL
jgi:hypothetical protein